MAEGITKEAAVGIDLGTTYSCVAVFQNGKAKVIADADGNRVMPSCVGFTDHGYIVGLNAKIRQGMNPKSTVYDVKRLLGRTFADPVVQEDMRTWSFEVVDVDDKPMIRISDNNGTKRYAPEDISSMVLKKMKDTAEQYLDSKVEKAVITVPAYFNNSQREATKTAAKLAGLEVLRIINEPTAAAMAYGYGQGKAQQAEKILVFDLGGGTFDVSILQLDDGILQVLATGGDTHLGGVDIDNKLAAIMFRHAQDDLNCPDDMKKEKYHRLTRSAEFAKCELSRSEKYHVTIDDFHENKQLKCDLHVSELESANAELFDKTIESVEKVLNEAKLTIQDINKVVLVGGSTRIPKVQSKLSELFCDKKGGKIDKSINPDEAVAKGAAVQAALLLGDDDLEDVLLLDVTPMSYGLEIRGTDMWTILKKNSTLPAHETTIATTVEENQREVVLKVYEGEGSLTRDNHYLAQVSLADITPAPAGHPKLIVAFDVDADGLLHITAKDDNTGNSQYIRIEPNSSHFMGGDRALDEEDNDEQIRQAALRKLQMKKHWIKYLIDKHFPDLKIMRHVADDILQQCSAIDEWLQKKQEFATVADIEDKLEELFAVCQDFPPDYNINPTGQLPGRSSPNTSYLPSDQYVLPVNQDTDDDDDSSSIEIIEDEVPEID